MLVRGPERLFPAAGNPVIVGEGEVAATVHSGECRIEAGNVLVGQVDVYGGGVFVDSIAAATARDGDDWQAVDGALVPEPGERDLGCGGFAFGGYVLDGGDNGLVVIVVLVVAGLRRKN